MVSKIKKNDIVLVIAGNDKGKTGTVQLVLKDDNSAIVTGINLVKKAMKSKEENFITLEKSINLSNLRKIDNEKDNVVRKVIAKDIKNKKVLNKN